MQEFLYVAGSLTACSPTMALPEPGVYLTWESTVYPDGGLYEGLVKDGQCHGKGVFQYADGDRRVAKRREAFFSLSSRAERLYEAEICFPHSLTRRVRSYEGQYVEGQMNGLGVYRWANGRLVVPAWKLSAS